MQLESTFEKILERYEFLKEKMLESANDSENFIKLSKEFSDLEEFATLINEGQHTLAKVEGLQKTLILVLTYTNFNVIMNTIKQNRKWKN